MQLRPAPREPACLLDLQGRELGMGAAFLIVPAVRPSRVAGFKRGCAYLAAKLHVQVYS